MSHPYDHQCVCPSCVSHLRFLAREALTVLERCDAVLGFHPLDMTGFAYDRDALVDQMNHVIDRLRAVIGSEQ